MIVGILAAVMFDLMIAFSYVSLAKATHDVGQVRLDFSFTIQMVLNPYFIVGSVLSVSSMFVRPLMFLNLGYMGTIIASEFSVVLMYLLTWYFFREPIGIRTIIAVVLGIAAVLLAASERT